MQYPIRTALISVSDKTGLEKLVSFLSEQGIAMISTGGTAKFISALGIKVIDVSEYTGFPEMMEGRLKTLHPKIHGGLLAKRSDKKHQEEAKEHNIRMIDLLVVNLYPFEKEASIENIDIGGPAMIRSAAKNHESVVVVTDAGDYETLIQEIKNNNGATSIEFRKKMAAKAFSRTAEYDSTIANWFSKDNIFPKKLNISAKLRYNLSYGENPHQKAALYISGSDGIANAPQLQGKDLSYNNLNDADAALNLVYSFNDPACAIIKHANPCGVGIASTISDAYDKALASDPVSSYGGIIAFNRTLDKVTANKFAKMFVEVIIAPEIDDAAKEILSLKKNLRILISQKPKSSIQIKSISGGFLTQEDDTKLVTADQLEIVTENKPTNSEIKEMLFAFNICKYVKSNAIVITHNGATIGIGAGQTSRVDSVKIAIDKAKEFDHKKYLKESVLASDAFFPFADGLVIAAEAGVKNVIQPGGSIRDNEVIEAANKYGVAMAFTKERHFRH